MGLLVLKPNYVILHIVHWMYKQSTRKECQGYGYVKDLSELQGDFSMPTHVIAVTCRIVIIIKNGVLNVKRLG
mgnify:FL=1